MLGLRSFLPPTPASSSDTGVCVCVGVHAGTGFLHPTLVFQPRVLHERKAELAHVFMSKFYCEIINERNVP